MTHRKNGHADIRKTREFHYNDQGLLRQQINEPGNQYAPSLLWTSLYQSQRYTYDRYGYKHTSSVSAKDRNNQNSNRTITRNTAFGHYQGRAARRVIITNPLGHSETRYYSLKHGKLLAQTGPNGLTSRWHYDALGRKTKHTRADGTFDNLAL